MLETATCSARSIADYSYFRYVKEIAVHTLDRKAITHPREDVRRDRDVGLRLTCVHSEARGVARYHRLYTHTFHTNE